MRGISLFLKPLSWVYGLILWVRHFLYDRGFFFSKEFNQPIIKIGNLSFGGTGKSPMTLFIAKYLRTKYSVYILSRGYGRIGSGIKEVLSNTSVEEVGDEPLMMKTRLPDTRIFVSSDRAAGIEYINSIDSGRKIIILDDAMQHRKLAGGYTILLSEYANPFFKDELFPMGRLRDMKSRAITSDAIIWTKAPTSGSKDGFSLMDFAPYSLVPTFFSSIRYLQYYDYFSNMEVALDSKVVVVSAIANAELFCQKISEIATIVKRFEYRDHYGFSVSDLHEWLTYCRENMVRQIVMTEKDAIKIKSFQNVIKQSDNRIVVLPIELEICDNQSDPFLAMIEDYIHQFDNI